MLLGWEVFLDTSVCFLMFFSEIVNNSNLAIPERKGGKGRKEGKAEGKFLLFFSQSAV